MSDLDELNEIFQKTLKEMDDGTLDFTNHGDCTGCGQCCSDLLPMTEQEIEKIRNYVKKNHIKAHNHGNFLSDKRLDMVCPFMDASKTKDKCDIYPVRPMICRYFVCNKEKRGQVSLSHLWNCKCVSVRQTFFG